VGFEAFPPGLRTNRKQSSYFLFADNPDVYRKEQFIGPNPLWDPQLAKLAGIAVIKLFGLVAIQLDKA
jgi:hypothetical protein